MLTDNSLRSFSNSHQHSYFALKVLAGLNQERELSSAFLLNLCGKNQIHLYQTVCISTQSTPQTSVFQERDRPKKILTDIFVWKKWCSLPWSGSWGRHAQTNALHDDLKDNCNEDYDFAINYKSKEFITHTHAHICGAFCGKNQSLIKSVWNYTKRHTRPFVLILWTSFRYATNADYRPAGERGKHCCEML